MAGTRESRALSISDRQLCLVVATAYALALLGCMAAIGRDSSLPFYVIAVGAFAWITGNGLAEPMRRRTIPGAIASSLLAIAILAVAAVAIATREEKLLLVALLALAFGIGNRLRAAAPVAR